MRKANHNGIHLEAKKIECVRSSVHLEEKTRIVFSSLAAFQGADETALGKISSYSRSLIQQHPVDGNDSESVANGEQSSPYMSNTAYTSPSTAISMAPIGDGVSSAPRESKSGMPPLIL